MPGIMQISPEFRPVLAPGFVSRMIKLLALPIQRHTFSRRQILSHMAGMGAASRIAAAPALLAAAQPLRIRAQQRANPVASPTPTAGLQLPSRFRADRALDSFDLGAGKRHVLAELDGPGCIRHIWTATNRHQLMSNRQIILRIYWDDEEKPSVEAPIGDFFGVCHGLFYYPINSVYLSVQEQTGFNSYFPMPFARKARVEVETGPENPGPLYYHIDWHRYPADSLAEDLRFHAAWRREFPTQSFAEEYTVMDAVGRGRLLGFVYGVRLYDDADRWSHGGAENIYIDGETTGADGLEPIYLRGSGGEDTFGTSYGGALHKPESHHYAGMPYYNHEDFGGGPRPSQRIGAYRFFEHDAITFERSIHFRFGCVANDICSTAYWYQAEPHRPFVRMPGWEKLKPGVELPRGETDLLIQTGGAAPGAVLASPSDGEWWLCGPYENANGEAMRKNLPPEEGASPDPAVRYDGGFGPKSPWRDARSRRADQNMARWVRRHSFHGFVDFSHVFRPWTKGVSITWPAAACAMTHLRADRDTIATLFLSWDDQVILRLNDEPPRDLGAQVSFRQRAIEVRLKRGVNRLTLKINNTKGKTWGAWCFAFRAVLPDGSAPVPFVAR